MKTLEGYPKRTYEFDLLEMCAHYPKHYVDEIYEHHVCCAYSHATLHAMQRKYFSKKKIDYNMY